jgi:hypothetical protein
MANLTVLLAALQKCFVIGFTRGPESQTPNITGSYLKGS